MLNARCLGNRPNRLGFVQCSTEHAGHRRFRIFSWHGANCHHCRCRCQALFFVCVCAQHAYANTYVRSTYCDTGIPVPQAAAFPCRYKPAIRCRLRNRSCSAPFGRQQAPDGRPASQCPALDPLHESGRLQSPERVPHRPVTAARPPCQVAHARRRRAVRLGVAIQQQPRGDIAPTQVRQCPVEKRIQQPEPPSHRTAALPGRT